MKISHKLIMLVSITLVSAGLAFAAYLMVLAPIDTIRNEWKQLEQAVAITEKLDLESSRLMVDPFETQIPVFDAAQKEYTDYFEQLKTSVVILPNSSQELADAFKAITNLKALVAGNISDLQTTATDLDAVAKTLFSTDTKTKPDLTRTLSIQRESANAADVMMAVFSSVQMVTKIRELHDTLLVTKKVIQKNYVIIQDEINRLSLRSATIAGIVALLVVIGSLVISLLIARSIATSVQKLVRTTAQMAAGDLTGRFNLTNKDEVGNLSRDLDNLLDGLNQSLVAIQHASSQNSEVRNLLVQSVSEATSSAVQIEANSESIRGQMIRLDGMIENASSEVASIGATINGFNQRIAAQNRHVEESVAAVTEMLASIDNIFRVTEKDREAASELVNESERGREVFEDAFERIGEITDNVSAIQEMAAVIAGIASQTNILAMNAAIEAAHAGEFGKGFAVVADEISKLAAASAASSDEIASTIQRVVIKITEASSTRDTTIRAFGAITSRIKDVSDSITEIHSNVSEMQTGSRQILEAMELLRGNSEQITNESRQLETSTQGVQQTVADIGRISHEVVANIGEISLGLKDISRSVRDVGERADQIGTIGNSLDCAVNSFKTRNLDGCTEAEPVPEAELMPS